MKILFISSEIAPFAKTGGLADVAGSLPGALKELGVDISSILPFYREVHKGKFPISKIIDDLKVPLGKERYSSRIYKTVSDGGVPVYLVEREDMYDRPNLYGDFNGDYYDNLARFTFFSRAVLEFIEKIDISPNIIHCHDWQTGLVPALVSGPYSGSPSLEGVKSVFTIHNIGYQGTFPAEDLSISGLSIPAFFHKEGLEFWGKISLLKAGIVYSDAITTVSPRYAREIKSAEYGMGMEGILNHRKDSLSGILNGVDYRIWNPALDEHIPEKYSAEDIKGKKYCKESVLKEMGLSASMDNQPLVCVVSRLDSQKGIDLIIRALEKLLNMNVGIIIFGSGGKRIEKDLLRASRGNEARMSVKIGFDEGLAHRIIAGADMILIPSRYEPCGLTQMYGLKYGTVPVVRATGGLDDTISEYDPMTGKGNGFKFQAFEPEEFLSAVRRAVELYRRKDVWKKLMKAGMNADFSWKRSAHSYLKLYEAIKRGK